MRIVHHPLRDASGEVRLTVERQGTRARDSEDNGLLDLLLRARRIAGRDRGALPLVIRRLALRRPEDARARAAMQEIMGGRADLMGGGDGPGQSATHV
jgi:hypothetical protein